MSTGDAGSSVRMNAVCVVRIAADLYLVTDERVPLLNGLFSPEFIGLLFPSCALACSPDTSATLRVFRAGFYRRRSDWLRLLG